MKKMLTNSEMELMDVFWSAKEPLSSLEILDMSSKWSETYIHVMLRALLKKEMIEVCGVVQSGKKYARQFRALVSQEEYEIELFSERGVKPSEILKIAAGLVEKSEGDANQHLLEELDKLIAELENKED